MQSRTQAASSSERSVRTDDTSEEGIETLRWLRSLVPSLRSLQMETSRTWRRAKLWTEEEKAKEGPAYWKRRLKGGA